MPSVSIPAQGSAGLTFVDRSPGTENRGDCSDIGFDIKFAIRFPPWRVRDRAGDREIPYGQQAPHMNLAHEIMIWGATARAASWSVARAGGKAIPCDLFADLDFPAGVEPQQLEDLSQAALQRLLENNPRIPDNIPFLPTGGWENTDTLPQSIAEQFQLFGCPGESLRQARDPFFWSTLLDNAGLPRLALRNSEKTSFSPLAEDAPEKITWLRKSRASVGGLAVRYLSDASHPPPGFYDQQFQPGLSCSALCISTTNKSDASAHTRLLGTSLQLTRDWNAELPFLYAGNAYPLERFAEVDSAALRTQADHCAQTLASGCGLAGIWGFDFVWDGRQLWVTEINPRYTAAVELWELVEQQAVLETAGWQTKNEAQLPGPHRPVAGLVKQIAYADREFRLPADWDWNQLIGRFAGPERESLWEPPAFSDLPRPGTTFRPAEPVCTIWAEAANRSAADETLQQRLAELRRHLPVI